MTGGLLGPAAAAAATAAVLLAARVLVTARATRMLHRWARDEGHAIQLWRSLTWAPWPTRSHQFRVLLRDRAGEYRNCRVRCHLFRPAHRERVTVRWG